MADDGRVHSILTSDLKTVDCPANGLLHSQRMQYERAKYKTDGKRITQTVTQRHNNINMTQIRISKGRKDSDDDPVSYEITVDGVKAMEDEDNIIRLRSFHAGPHHRVLRNEGNKEEYKFDTAQGHYDSVSKSHFVGPVMITAAIEAGEPHPQSVRVELYQKVRVENNDHPVKFLKEQSMETHSTEDVNAPAVFVPYPAIFTHAPYIEIVDNSARRLKKSKEGATFWPWLIKGIFQCSLLGTGWLALILNLARYELPQFFPSTIERFSRNTGDSPIYGELLKRTTTMQFGGYPTQFNLNSKLEVIGIFANICFFLFSAMSTKGLEGFTDKEAAILLHTRSKKDGTQGVYYTAPREMDPLVEPTPPVATTEDEFIELGSEKYKKTMNSGLNKLGNNVETLLRNAGPITQPPRVRFTMRRLTDCLRSIRSMRSKSGSRGTLNDASGQHLQAAGYAAEKVLIDWILEADGKKWSSYLSSFTERISEAWRTKETINDNFQKQPEHDKKKNQEMVWLDVRRRS